MSSSPASANGLWVTLQQDDFLVCYYFPIFKEADGGSGDTIVVSQMQNQTLSNISKECFDWSDDSLKSFTNSILKYLM